MTKVTKRKEGSHWVVNVGGRGMSLAFSEGEANRKVKEFRNQLKRLKKVRK